MWKKKKDQSKPKQKKQRNKRSYIQDQILMEKEKKPKQKKNNAIKDSLFTEYYSGPNPDGVRALVGAATACLCRVRVQK